MGGKKFDIGKPRWDLLPAGTLSPVVDVLTLGADRYGDNNWQGVDEARRRYYAAMMRHIDAWWGGEITDKDSGLPHLAHAVCNALFLSWFDGGGSEG